MSAKGAGRLIRDTADALVDVRRLRGKRIAVSYYRFFLHFWPEIPGNPPLVEGPHIKIVCDELQRVGEVLLSGKPKEHDLIINIPPGSSKSSMATVLFPVWLWVRDPSVRIISVSYEATLAIRHAAISRDLMDTDRFQALYCHLFSMRSNFDAKMHYKNDAGGERMVAGTRGTVTGSHADLILIDDPIDPKGAASEQKMKTVNDFLEKTLASRKTDKAVTPTILIMQRLHEDDPTARMLARGNVRHICLPATDDYPISPEEYRGIYVGGYLDPERMGPKVLEEQRAALGSTEYGGQYGQQPMPIGGNIVKQEWLPVLEYYKLPQGARDAVRHFVADTAYKEKTANDPSGCLCYSEFRGYLFLFDFLKGRWGFPDLVANLEEYVFRMGQARSILHIEPKASGVSVVQHLRAHSPLNVVEWKMVEGDKVARLNAVTAFLEARRVVLVAGPWNEDFIRQVTMFPNAKHDEEVDCLVMAINNTLARPAAKGYRSSR